jgi:glutaminyl-tRNA synthetase
VTCTEIIKDEAGKIIELRCTYDPKTTGGNAPDGRKVKGTIHWVSADHAVDATIHQYGYLFTEEAPGATGDFLEDININSLTILSNCKLEPALKDAPMDETIQFERLGYFCPDKTSTSDHLIFNQTIGLRDTWAKNKS